ncbi:MAG: hypothetical protein WC516_09245 [Patescibacteria group bacterium]|jgi:hypothetical protein
MIWQVPKMWDQEDVWILGGGPSLPKQFDIPDRVIKSVVYNESPPSVYSPYMSFLHDKHVIGVNVAYLIGDWIDIVFFGDSSFFLSQQKKLSEFVGIKVTCHPSIEGHNWIKYLSKDSKKPRGISPNPKMVSWNGNSGAAAISIAANAGAKRIFLLGFDMELNSENRQHWHDLYHRFSTISVKNNKGLPFERHLRGFIDIYKDAKHRGIQIINVCPNSAIKEFPKINLKDVL